MRATFDDDGLGAMDVVTVTRIPFVAYLLASSLLQLQPKVEFKCVNGVGLVRRAVPLSWYVAQPRRIARSYFAESQPFLVGFARWSHSEQKGPARDDVRNPNPVENALHIADTCAFRPKPGKLSTVPIRNFDVVDLGEQPEFCNHRRCRKNI